MKISDNLKVDWIDFHREPKHPPDPRYPSGKPVDLRVSEREAYCVVDLPYPAPRCGLYIVRCALCRVQIGVTTAGRPDDPTRVSVPCKRRTAH